MPFTVEDIVILIKSGEEYVVAATREIPYKVSKDAAKAYGTDEIFPNNSCDYIIAKTSTIENSSPLVHVKESDIEGA